MMGILTWPWMHLRRDLKTHLLNITLKQHRFKQLLVFSTLRERDHPEKTKWSKSKLFTEDKDSLKQVAPENQIRLSDDAYQFSAILNRSPANTDTVHQPGDIADIHVRGNCNYRF